MGGRANRLGVAKSAARTFVGALRPDDQVMIVAIGGETTIVAPLSAGSRGCAGGDRSTGCVGTTPLYDATVGALDAIQPARGRRALVRCRMGRIGTATQRPRTWWIVPGATTC
jgi:hypothetical protein